MKTLRAGTLSCLLMFSAQAGDAQETGNQAIADANIVEPQKLVRVLDHIQDEIAGGSASSHQLRKKLLIYIDGKFKETATDLWMKDTNASAMVLFGLNGGNPNTIKRIASLPGFPETAKRLAEAVVAFAAGRIARSRQLLEDLDETALPATLAGPLHLMRSQITEAKDPIQQLVHLQKARLAAPGTLIEETALRRSMKIAAAQTATATEAAVRLARQYFSRFDTSYFHADFDRQFVSFLVRRKPETVQRMLDQLHPVLKTKKPQRLCNMFLMISRDALMMGALETAEIGNDRSETFCAHDPGRLAQMSAYRFSAKVLDIAPGDETARIDESLMRQLGTADKRLVQAARMTMRSIRAPLSLATLSQEEISGADFHTPTMKKAAALLANSDREESEE